MINEASDELESIEGADRLSPDTLGVRCSLYFIAKKWDFLEVVARRLAKDEPKRSDGWITWAFALKETGRVEEAREVLVQAERFHPLSGNVHYNLACYHCLLGDQSEARKRLRKACQLESRWKEKALDDPDLKAMWDEIALL